MVGTDEVVPLVEVTVVRVSVVVVRSVVLPVVVSVDDVPVLEVSVPVELDGNVGRVLDDSVVEVPVVDPVDEEAVVQP